MATDARHGSPSPQISRKRLHMKPPDSPKHRAPMKDEINFPQATPQTPRHARVMGSRVVCATPHRGKGKALDNYSLGDRLGRGASATVYKAIHLKTGEFVAIKQIPLDKIKAIESVMGEIELLQNLQHPNIVTYIGFMKDEEYLNIVLEYCENGSLAMICRKFGSFPENLLAVYMRQVLEGLVYLHDQGTIHRDIKGANILTTKEGIAKLADFGVATRSVIKIEEEEAQKPGVVGTPHWMAPEVIQMQEPSPACDIWSLGATIVELRTGQPPYGHLTDISAMYSIVQEDSSNIIPGEASGSLRDFLQLCFEKDPTLRVRASKLLNHHWIRKFGGVVSDLTGQNGVRTIQEMNSPQRKKRLAVPSRLNLREIYQKGGNEGQETQIMDPDENYEDDFVSLGVFGGARAGTGMFAKATVGNDTAVGAGSKQNVANSVILKKPRSRKNLRDYIDASDESDFEVGESQVAFKRTPITAAKQSSEQTSHGFGKNTSLDDQSLDINIDDPFEGLQDLSVDAPDEYVTAAIEESEKLIGCLQTVPHRQLELIFLRLCELINAVPQVYRIIQQSRFLQKVLYLLGSSNPDSSPTSIPVRTAFLELALAVIESGELQAVTSFWLAGGLSFVLTQASCDDEMVKKLVLKLLYKFCIGTNDEMARQLAYREDAIKVLCSFFDTKATSSALLEASTVTIAVFTSCGPRNRADLWHHFNSYDLLAKIADLIHLNIWEDRKLIHQNLFALVASFTKTPSDLLMTYATRPVLRRLMRAYLLLPTESQYRLVVLQFFKEVSVLQPVLDAMHRGGLLPHLIVALRKSLNSNNAISHASVNHILPVFYNYTRISRSRQREVAEYCLLPLLHETVARYSALREFAWPIFCALAHSGHPQCWKALWLEESAGVETFVNLMREPGWEALSVAALGAWMDGEGQETRVRAKFLAIGGQNELPHVLKAARGQDSFEMILNAVAALLDRHRVLCRDIDCLAIFTALKPQLSATSISSGALVHILQIITWIIAAKPTVGKAVSLSTGIHDHIEQLYTNETNVPVLARKLISDLHQQTLAV